MGRRLRAGMGDEEQEFYTGRFSDVRVKSMLAGGTSLQRRLFSFYVPRQIFNDSFKITLLLQFINSCSNRHIAYPFSRHTNCNQNRNEIK